MTTPTAPGPVQARVWSLLERSSPDDRAGRAVDTFIAAMIVANVLAFVLETMPAMAEAYGPWFYAFEVISIAIFTLEFALRFWSAPAMPGAEGLSRSQARWRYMRTPMAFIDFISIAPWLLAVLVGWSSGALPALRILRLFKLARYSTSIHLVVLVTVREARSLAAALLILFSLLFLAASGAYLVEKAHQPEHFGSIPAATWWAIATLTTVGYGDVTPITPLGRVFGALVMIIGVGFAALPAGILAGGFAEELRNRRALLRDVVHGAMTRGPIDAPLHEALSEYAERLGLARRDLATAKLESRRAIENGESHRCPLCGTVHADGSGTRER